jgi:septal ring factor EnvC (AmiA/AmiB activator)
MRGGGCEIDRGEEASRDFIALDERVSAGPNHGLQTWPGSAMLPLTEEGAHMHLKQSIFATAIMAALFGLAAHVSLASGADLSPPEDGAAAQKLNSAIADCNRSEEDRFQTQQAAFQREKQQNDKVLMQYQEQNDALQRQFDDLRANYALLEAQDDEQRKQNRDLQQKYQEIQQQLEDAQQRYADIVKMQQTPPTPPPGKDLLDRLKDVF